MKLAPSFNLQGKHKVCKLNKSLYGLKQASRQWFLKFSKFLLASGFIQSKADYALFTKRSNNSLVALLVYVINDFKAIIDQKFKIKDLGKLKYFLVLEVAYSNAINSLCQHKFALNILTDSAS